MDEEIYNTEEKNTDPTCPRCGLRSYDDECRSCGTPIIDKNDTKDEEDDNYNWREHKR